MYFSTTGMILRPDLVGEHGHLDELGVLEAVADDRRVVVGHRHDGEQLRLGACLQPEAVRLAEVEHLLDDLPLLVHLDGVDADVAACVLVLGDRRWKRVVDVGEPVLEDVAEPDEQRKHDAARCRSSPAASGRWLGGSLVGWTWT